MRSTLTHALSRCCQSVGHKHFLARRGHASRLIRLIPGFRFCGNRIRYAFFECIDREKIQVRCMSYNVVASVSTHTPARPRKAPSTFTTRAHPPLARQAQVPGSHVRQRTLRSTQVARRGIRRFATERHVRASARPCARACWSTARCACNYERSTSS